MAHRENVCDDFLKYIENRQPFGGFDKEIIKALAIIWAGEGKG